MTLVIDPKVALLKGVDPVQFCVFQISEPAELPVFFDKIQCQTGTVAFRCVSDTGRTGLTREKQMPDQQDLPGQGG